jgi:hypothetical protein
MAEPIVDTRPRIFNGTDWIFFEDQAAFLNYIVANQPPGGNFDPFPDEPKPDA